MQQTSTGNLVVPPPNRRTPVEPTNGLAALSNLRTFNRYELKYIADRRLVTGFREELPAKLDRDPHGLEGFYPVWSTYYDTSDLLFYWEKMEGERFRRKLRIRHYGDPDELTAETPVWVEIKQRVNRVTQKRRLSLPYAEALRLCSGADPSSCAPEDEHVVEEILVLANTLRLRPIVTLGYVREAYLGRGQDSGLRLTIDSRIRGRDRDLHLNTAGENRFFVQPHLSVVEVKVNERVPYWMTEHIARHNLTLRRISKYCQGVQAYDVAPRSAIHNAHSDDSSLVFANS